MISVRVVTLSLASPAIGLVFLLVVTIPNRFEIDMIKEDEQKLEIVIGTANR